MPLRIVIQPGSTLSIYRQIVEQVCAAVLAGRVDDDEPLPSVRKLAEKLVVNPQTVARAYAELVRERVLESRPGRGMFVSKRRQIYTKAERVRRVEQAVTALVTEGLMLGFSIDELLEQVALKGRDLTPTRSATKAAAAVGSPSTE